MADHPEQTTDTPTHMLAESDLCTACGICCDGSLFRFGALQSDEVGRMRALGMNLTERRRGTAFTIPCTRFDSCCTIYPDRPATCRAFACKLLKACKNGETSWERGHEIVATAVAMGANVPADEKTDTPVISTQDTLAARRAKLEAVAYQRYVDRHFRSKPRIGIVQPVPADRGS